MSPRNRGDVETVGAGNQGVAAAAEGHQASPEETQIIILELSTNLPEV